MEKPVDGTLSASVQDYLKAIYAQTRDGQPTSTIALAEALDCRPASVTNMLQKLDETHPDLVIYVKHHGVLLTEKGKKAALEIVRRHRLLEQFLYQVLEYPLDRVHAEAEELEHVISPFFTEQLCHLLNDPIFDPHGDPIPDRDLNLHDPRVLSTLMDMELGRKGTVCHISNQSPDVLQYLNTIGIKPGSELRVTRVNPIDGTRQVEVVGSDQPQVLGKRISENILLEINKDGPDRNLHPTRPEQPGGVQET
jgi:DtxR family Mn-dependent transcriptional regulator